MSLTHKVTLQINQQSRIVEFRIIKEGTDEITLSDGTGYLQGYPQALIKVDGQKYCILMFPADDLSNFDDEQKLSILLFAAPHWVELHIRQWLAPGKSPSDKEYYQSLSIGDSDKITVVKEHAAGETYEQRSHVCYEDACKIVRDIWRDPHNTDKSFTLINLRGSSVKRRIYEKNEMKNVIHWGEGEGYWGKEKITVPQTGREVKVGEYIIEGSRIRELETKLSSSQLGVLPEIVGRIDIDPGFSFLSDGVLQGMIERDCREINEAAKVGAAKAVIVMCGSVIEALIYDLLKSQSTQAQHTAQNMANNKNHASDKTHLLEAAKSDLSKWSAYILIKVAHEMLPNDVTANVVTYAHVLRKYRNLIHPGKEKRSLISIDHNTAAIAISVVNLVISGMR